MNDLRTNIIQQIEEKINPSEIVSQVNDNGAAVIPKLFSGEALERLNYEFSNAFTRTYECIQQVRHEPGKQLWCHTELMNKEEFPAVEAVFINSLFKKISREIIVGSEVGEDFAFHHKIAFTHEFKPITITDVHFDALRALKFFIYLVDVDESNGAFRFAKGTHIENSKYRAEFLRQGGQLRDLFNVAGSNEAIDLKPICAPAGTLIIFDTDTFHQGGELQEGKERKVMRALSLFTRQAGKMRHKKCSKAWLKNIILPPKVPKGYELRARTRGSARAK